MEKNDKTTSKSVIISAEIHENLKNYCKNKGQKIGYVIEELISKFLKDNTKK